MITEDFLNYVEEHEIEELVNEETIIQLVQGGENHDEGEDNEGDEEGNELPDVSAKEGLKALEIVNMFLLQQSRDCSDEIR
ncbi:11080_t:CDS:1, partial [Paraglomus occultum]